MLISATAGFYPVTVTYLSLFYTRFEFGRRLSLFYSQAAIGGALGGIISYLVFSRFGEDKNGAKSEKGWRPWQVLFLLEGSLTIVVAFAGFFWLPHSVDTAWFLTPEERQYASSRVIRDRDMQNTSATTHSDEDDEQEHDEESHGLLHPSKMPTYPRASNTLEDRGLTPQDIFSAVFNTKIWHILACNILSAIPVYAFSIFLPLVLAPLTHNSTPALINLLTAPPHICGAVVLFIAARYSDKHRARFGPVLFGLAIVIVGLTFVIVLPTAWVIPRYLALIVLLSGTYIASPLTVVWISGNTPSPGKRALLLGINGWGNFAGVLAALLFRPKYAASGYKIPLCWTLGSVLLSALGFFVFRNKLHVENKRRKRTLDHWSEEDTQMESSVGKGPLPHDQRWTKSVMEMTRRHRRLAWLTTWLEETTQGGREGDEKMTFAYGL
jgi:MFS family permease